MARPANDGPWESVVLSKICELPRSQIRPAEFPAHRYYVGLEHIDGVNGTVIQYEDVSKAKLKSSKFPFDKSCILYGKLRPYLNKVALPDVSGICSTDILPLRPKPAVIREYLYYLLRTPFFVRTATSKSTGANLPRIRPKTLLEIRVPLPPLRVQQETVEMLKAADRLRHRRLQANQLTSRVIRSIFLRIFGDPATNPMNWPISTIGEIVTKAQYGISQKLDDDPAHVPVIRMNNVTSDGGLDIRELRYADVGFEVLRKYRLEKADLLFNRTNSRELVGKTGFFDKVGEFVFASYLIRVKVNSQVATPEYVWAFLNSRFGKETLLRKARGAVGQANINSQELKAINLPLPPLRLQQNFSGLVNRTLTLVQKQVSSEHEIKVLFQTLLGKAFSGKAEVS